MNSKRKKIVIIVSMILLFSVLFGTVAVASLAEGGISFLWGNVNDNKEETEKYDKPSVGDIAQDGAYPDEMKSNSSANAQEKKWYEYVTYSKTPIGEKREGNIKYVFYDPYDYNYGMIMEFSDPESNYGEFYDSEGYTTANEISVSYSKSKSFSWADGDNISFGFEEEGGASLPLLADAKVKFTQTFGWSHSESNSDDSSASKEVTYNALYFNSNGTPYRWRVVKYVVSLPLYCEKQVLTKGEWVVTETNYCLLVTVEGTCREWIDNVAYVEDWRTGEPVQVEKFWKKYFNQNTLMNAYKYHMIPES